MKAGRIVMIVVGSLLALAGFGMTVGGAGAIVGITTQRDDDGFFRTGDVRLASPTFAITSDRIDLASWPDAGKHGLLRQSRIELQPHAAQRSATSCRSPSAT